ncbi:hypothetical protein [Sulfuricella sp.]|uniref:hypothetical protein n=1 Tax=Sulfuricella sp. TaxID=2099377 RepID=UPI002D1530B6|nr:hypothetical protein [Sulfuricella sp.]HUX63968.1 hypothetical protein [Sulfuricella sp.]
MDIQNLGYALTQVVHNFGASAVVGGPVSSLWLAPRPELDRSLAWLVCLGWAAQIASGAAFGAISFYYYGKFPDIGGLAIAALAIKVACAVSGFSLAAFYLLRAARWTTTLRRRIWLMLAGLSATALTAAAFLRWFS